MGRPWASSDAFTCADTAAVDRTVREAAGAGRAGRGAVDRVGVGDAEGVGEADGDGLADGEGVAEGDGDAEAAGSAAVSYTGLEFQVKWPSGPSILTAATATAAVFGWLAKNTWQSKAVPIFCSTRSGHSTRVG